MATQAQLAGHLDLTRTAVADLIQRGILPAADKGQLDLAVCRVAYLRHLREQAAGRSDSELARWRAELAQEQTIAKKRENAVAAGELVSKGEVIAGLQQVFGHCRARLLAIPSKAAPMVALLGADPQAIKDKLTELIHECCDALSRTEGLADADLVNRSGDGGGHHASDADLGATAEAQGQRVGGRKPQTQPGVKRRAR